MNEMIDLQKKLGTTYVWNGFQDDLKQIIEKAKADNDILDIALCRLGPDCAYLIDLANETSSLRIINSKEPLLDEILKHNRKVSAIKNGDVPNDVIKKRIWLDFEPTGEKSVKNLLAEIKSSDPGVVWFATSEQKGYTENHDIIMALLNMQFYKRMFDVSSGQRLMRLFITYRSVLDIVDLDEANVFWYIIGGNYAIRTEVDRLGEITIPGIGTFSKEEFITKNGVIPYWIGTESIIGNQRRLEIRNRLIKQIKTVDMMSRSSHARSILGLIKQYGDN